MEKLNDSGFLSDLAAAGTSGVRPEQYSPANKYRPEYFLNMADIGRSAFELRDLPNCNRSKSGSNKGPNHRRCMRNYLKGVGVNKEIAEHHISYTQGNSNYTEMLAFFMLLAEKYGPEFVQDLNYMGHPFPLDYEYRLLDRHGLNQSGNPVGSSPQQSTDANDLPDNSGGLPDTSTGTLPNTSTGTLPELQTAGVGQLLSNPYLLTAGGLVAVAGIAFTLKRS